MSNLATIIIERVDKKVKVQVNEVCNVIHIKGRGVNEYYKILGRKEDLNEGWLEETIKDFYSAHLSVPEKIELTYFKKE